MSNQTQNEEVGEKPKELKTIYSNVNQNNKNRVREGDRG